MAYLVAFVLGFLAGWWTFKWSHPIGTLKPRLAVPSAGPGENKCYARFHFADGRVEVKKLLSADLDPYLQWKGRNFEIAEWTEDGQVYREVVNG